MTTKQPADYAPGQDEPVSLEAGDICIAATWREGEVDIRRNMGECRVLVYDAALTLKGALWTGQIGLVLGLGWCPISRTLFASDATSATVTRFSADGSRLGPFAAMQGKPFGPFAVTGSGDILIGEHIRGDKPPFLGGGEIYRFAAGGELLARYAADRDPGKFGFHGVTSMALSQDDTVATYISETGRRMMQYDLANDAQLPDLFALSDDEDKVTAGFALLADGNILLAHVYGASIFSPDGDLLKSYDIPADRGWAAVRACADGDSFMIANFFTGRLERRALESGDVLAAADTGLVFALASIVEIS